MGISGIGSRNTYIYNTQTGKLSSKDGQQDAFVDYFNGDISGDEDDTLNGFDRARKADINNLIEVWAQVDKSLFNDPDKVEYEITTETVDAVTSTVQVDGGKIFTCYSGGFFTCIDPSSSFKRRDRSRHANIRTTILLTTVSILPWAMCLTWETVTGCV